MMIPARGCKGLAVGGRGGICNSTEIPGLDLPAKKPDKRGYSRDMGKKDKYRSRLIKKPGANEFFEKENYH